MPGLHKEVKEYVAMCESCAKVKDHFTKVRSPLKPLTADYPLQVVSQRIL